MTTGTPGHRRPPSRYRLRPHTTGDHCPVVCTRCRRVVDVEEIDEFRAAQDLFEQPRGRGEDVGLTTVYRTLQSLADAGEVDVLRFDSGEAYYRRCSRGHHHHLVCRDCGRTVEVTGPTVERWADRIAAEHGFTDVGHSLEILGRCTACAG